jgi:hypothetical protein
MGTFRMVQAAFAAAATAAVTAAAAALVQPLQVKSGESVTLTIDDGGRTVETSRGAARAMTPFERAAAANFSSQLAQATGPNAVSLRAGERGMPEPDRIPAGAVELTLRPLGDNAMMLVVRNGYSGALSYKAVLTRGDRAVRTDVCEVLPGKPGFEHWPYGFDTIAVYDLKLVPWIEGQSLTCK